MKLKKIVKVLLIIFAVFYVLRSPANAASTLRGAGQAAYQGVLALADSAARFFDALLKGP
jgi:hypothetical protein